MMPMASGAEQPAQADSAPARLLAISGQMPGRILVG
jgi:hypothetical protein